MSVIAWFQTEEDWVQVLILWVYRGFISTRATNSESDNDPYKIFKYGVYYVACVQPPLPSKKLERIFFEGRGGCIQARCSPNQYQPFENVAIYLEMHGSPDLYRVYRIFEIFNGCSVICSILAS